MSKMIKLSELCLKITDGSHYSPEGVEDGYPMLSSKDMLDLDFDFSQCKYISQEDYRKLVDSDCKPLVNDVLIIKDGNSYLQKVFVNREERECVILSSIGVLRPDTNRLNPYYLKYYLTSGYVKNEVAKKYVSGSALPRIILKNFGNIEVPYVPIEEQNRIVSILKIIDDKIENNNKINAELESMAKTIYDYWFLQFDFPDKSGKPYKSSGGKMVWNEELKREIPEGWDAKCIKDIENHIVTGKTPSTKTKEYYNGEVPFITIGDIRGNMFVVSTEQTLSIIGAETQTSKYIPEDSICVSCIASPGLVGFTTERSQTNQQINSIVCKNRKNRGYLYFALRDYFIYSAGAKTGNTFANMNKEDFSNILLIYDKNVVEKYYDETKNTFSLIKNNLLQNKELVALRNFLLPLLMNGQIGF